MAYRSDNVSNQQLISAGKPVPSKPDPLIVDAPLWYHAPKLLIWTVFQGTLLYEAIAGEVFSTWQSMNIIQKQQGICNRAAPCSRYFKALTVQFQNFLWLCAGEIDNYRIDCNAESKEGLCAPSLHTKIISIVWGALLVVYFVTYGYYKRRARARLGKLPYNRFWTGNLLDSWQVGCRNFSHPFTPFYRRLGDRQGGAITESRVSAVSATTAPLSLQLLVAILLHFSFVVSILGRVD